MPSVSKNLKQICENSALNHTAAVRTVSPGKHEHLQGVREYDDNLTIINIYLD